MLVDLEYITASCNSYGHSAPEESLQEVKRKQQEGKVFTSNKKAGYCVVPTKRVKQQSTRTFPVLLRHQGTPPASPGSTRKPKAILSSAGPCTGKTVLSFPTYSHRLWVSPSQ